VTDLEHVLGPRLNDLADYLTEPVGTVPAGAAIARYRRQRRTRAGLAAVAAAVALIAIGVPTAMSTLGAGRPGGGTAHQGPAAPSPDWSVTLPADGTGSSGVTTHVELDPPPPGAAADAQAVLEQEQLHATAALLGAQGPVRLTGPARWGSCPKAAPGLSAALHTDVVYWQGALPGGPDGCQFANAAGTAGSSSPEDRLSVGIGFLRGATVIQMEHGVLGSAATSGGRCAVADAPEVAASAELQRCTLPGEVRTYLDVPDAGGAGIWVLSVTVGDRYPGDPAGTALAAVTRAAQSAFGG